MVHSNFANPSEIVFDAKYYNMACKNLWNLRFRISGPAICDKGSFTSYPGLKLAAAAAVGCSGNHKSLHGRHLLFDNHLILPGPFLVYIAFLK